MKPTTIILGALLLVAGVGVFLYQRELSRQADERCAELHSKYDAHSLTRFAIESQLNKSCDGLTAQEKTADREEKRAMEERVRDAECSNALRTEGANSTDARKYCSKKSDAQ
jgi:hypothetical protein